MKIVEMNVGKKVDYVEDGYKVTFNDELTLDLSKYQRDFDVELDICCNNEKQLVIGTNSGEYYVAQIQIPAKEYQEILVLEDEEESEEESEENRERENSRVLLPLNMSEVTLVLWSVENILGGNE